VSETPTIFELFGEVKRAVGPVGKDSRNKQQGFNFRGVDAVVNATADALDRHGVIIIPMLESVDYSTEEVGGNRTPMAVTRVKVCYRFTGPRGDHFDVIVPGEAMDSGDKGTAKAMSVAYRIALIQTLNLPTGDPDPDSQTYERSPRGGSAGAAFDNAAPSRPGNGGQHGGRKPRPEQPATSYDPQVEHEWVRDFLGALADTVDDEGIADRRKEINKALSARTITPRTSSELNQAVNERRQKLANGTAA
jgi:hypothetical protein